MGGEEGVATSLPFYERQDGIYKCRCICSIYRHRSKAFIGKLCINCRKSYKYQNFIPFQLGKREYQQQQLESGSLSHRDFHFPQNSEMLFHFQYSVFYPDIHSQDRKVKVRRRSIWISSFMLRSRPHDAKKHNSTYHSRKKTSLYTFIYYHVK